METKIELFYSASELIKLTTGFKVMVKLSNGFFITVSKKDLFHTAKSIKEFTTRKECTGTIEYYNETWVRITFEK